MSTLPEHRRAIAGRTWPQPWNPAAMDPIRRYSRTNSRLSTVLRAIVCLSACVLIVWLAAQGV